MDVNTLALFTHELRNQCLYVEAGFGLFNQSLEKQSSSGVFYAGQSILLATSHVAGTLWPARARSRARGEALREALKLPEKHTLNDKRLVSLWDHADEKLEEWITATKGQMIGMDFVGPKSQLGDGKVADANIYRLYDPQAHTFYFRGTAYQMQGLAKAVSDVGSRILTLHKQLMPSQPESDGALEEATAIDVPTTMADKS